MKNFLIKWFVNIITLFIVIHIIAGVSAESWESIIVAALMLGLLNAFVKPFVIFITLPITILTLGFFTLIINGFIFYIAGKFVAGFEVINFWSAFWAAMLFSIISSILNFILTPKTNIKFESFAYRPYNKTARKDDNIIDVEGKIEEDDKGG